MNEHAQQWMKRRRRGGLFGDLFERPARVNERLCPHCKKPHHLGPQPVSIRQFSRHNLGAVLYPAGSWGRESLVLRFGRWRASSGHFFLSEFIPVEELPDYIRLAEQVHAFLTEAAKATKQRRS